MTQRSMRMFWLLWFGQFVSTVGSALTAFALGIWVYEQTGSVTLLSLAAMVMPIARSWSTTRGRALSRSRTSSAATPRCSPMRPRSPR